MDDQGRPVDKVLVISRLFILPHSPYWRGYGGEVPQPTESNTFEVSGLAPGKECAVYFLNAEHRLGATQVLRAGLPDATVTLKPCGQAIVRFVDVEGKPRAGYSPTIFFVATPGAYTYDYDAAKQGKLSADEDFVANVDSLNWRPSPKADEQGRITFSALIPGATYRVYGQKLVYGQKNNKPQLLKEFTVSAGERRDLGEFTVESKD